MSKHHDLKCDPAPFAEVKAGRKLSELRLNDRDYQSGDTVTMREYDRDAGKYTGDTCGPFTIGHILREGYGLPEGCVMFSLLASTGEGESPEGGTEEDLPKLTDLFGTMKRPEPDPPTEAEIQLAAWQSAFGTTQLTHALARLEAAESAVSRLERERDEARAVLSAGGVA